MKPIDQDMCLLFQTLGEVGLNKITDQLLRSNKHDQLFWILFLMDMTLTNCAVIEKLCSSKTEIIASVLKHVRFEPQKDHLSLHSGVYRYLFDIISLCVMVTKSPSFISELVDHHDIFDHILIAVRDDHGNSKWKHEEAVIQAIRLAHLLIALGNIDVTQHPKACECCETLLQYEMKTAHSTKCIWYKKNLRDAMAGKETDVVSQQPYQRIAAALDRPYVVYCSSPACRRVVQQEGILRCCAKCMLSRYCNKQCQTHHWENGHKKRCLGCKANS